MSRFAWALVGAAGLLGCTTQPKAMAQHKPVDLLPKLGGETLRAQGPDGATIPTGASSDIIPVSGKTNSGKTMAQVIARVNGTPILQEEVINAVAVRIEEIRKQYPNEDFSKVQEQLMGRVLDEIIDREVILHDALLKVPPAGIQSVQQYAAKEFEANARKEMDRLGLKTIDELKEHHKKNGRSFEIMRRQMERNTIAMEWVKNLIIDKINQISREDMLDYYKKKPEEFNKKERIVWQHIFIDVDRFKSTAEARHQAEVVWQMARNVTTDDAFGEIAQKHSHSLIKTGRAIGTGQYKGEIEPKELENYLFQLPEGGMAPLIETKKGYYILRCTQHELARVIAFEDSCTQIKKRITDLLVEEEMKRIVQGMKEKAFIEKDVATK